jgi:hypothetical protein
MLQEWVSATTHFLESFSEGWRREGERPVTFTILQSLAQLTCDFPEVSLALSEAVNQEPLYITSMPHVCHLYSWLYLNHLGQLVLVSSCQDRPR